MPRGGRSRPMRSYGSSYSSGGYSPSTYKSKPPPPPSAKAVSPQHPGLMKQMAATAGGVAAGSLIAGALMGPRENVVIVNEQREQNQQKQEDPCAKEIKDLLNCIQMIQQTNENISVCEGFRLRLGKCR